MGSDKEEGGKWPNAGTAGAIYSMGSKHIKKDVTVSFQNIYNHLSPEIFFPVTFLLALLANYSFC